MALSGARGISVVVPGVAGDRESRDSRADMEDDVAGRKVKKVSGEISIAYLRHGHSRRRDAITADLIVPYSDATAIIAHGVYVQVVAATTCWQPRYCHRGAGT